MELNSILFGGFSFAAGLASLAIAVYLAPHWKTRSAGRLILLKACIAVWAMAYAMEFFSPSLSLILWWVRVEYFGAAWVGFFLFDFILSSSRHKNRLPRPLYLTMACIPVLTIILALTNDSHHLMWQSAVLDATGPIPVVDFVRGPFFWGFVIFSYGLLLLSTLVLIRSLASARGLLKKQEISILVGILFPWAANLFYVIPIRTGPLPDLTPIAFTISGAAFSWGLMRYQMLSLIPLAYETMIESMGDPVICLDSHNRILDINRAGRRAFSIARDLPGHRDIESEFPELYQCIAPHLKAEPVEIEVPLSSVQGGRDWDMRIFPLSPAKRRPSGWLILLRDITERNKTQAALVESEQLHRTILQAAPNPAVLYDSEYRVIHLNPAFTRIFGWELEELLGKTIDFIPEKDGDQAKAALKKALQEKKIHDFSTRRLTKSGELIDVSINAALCGTGHSRSAYMVVNFTDITKIKQTEKELRNTRNYVRSIINSMPSVLIGLDADQRVTQWNSEAARITGLAPENAEGLFLAQAFPQLAAHLPDMAAIIRSRIVSKAARIPLRCNQKMMTTDITIYPVSSDAGVVIRIDDISDRLRMEEMMVQSEKMLSVGGLAAGMAHEINNPLAGMIQSLQVIRNRLITPIPANHSAAEKSGINLSSLSAYLEERQILSMMDMMMDSGLRAAGIVSNMLSFSRKSGQRKSPHDLTAILDDTLSLVQNDYRMKNQYDFKAIDILRDYAQELPPVFCQRGEIQQVLLNILKNGAEAMADAATPSPSFHIRCYKENHQAVIRIRDNGPGMDAPTRKRIFEPFFTTKEVGLGTGLGLSVSYFIITENHGGILEVDSQPGRGTTFIVSLPLNHTD